MEASNMTQAHVTAQSGHHVGDDPMIDPVHAAEYAWAGGIQQPFWLKFDPPPYLAHLIIGIIVTVVGVVAVAGNLIVIVIFLRFRSLRTAGNLLIINLAVVDLLMASSNCPFYAISSFYARWVFHDSMCVIYGFCGATFGLLSINTIAAVALDRYLVITRTTSVGQRKNPRQTYCMILVAWINSLIWAVPPLLGWNRYVLEGYLTSCSFDYLTAARKYRSLVLSMFVCGFVVPLTIVIFCYSYIYITVHRHECMFRATKKRLNAKVILRGRERLYSTELRMVKTAMLVLLFYLISWMPYAAVSLMGICGYSDYLRPLSSVIPAVMAKMSSVYNPFIYTISHHRFRKKLRILFSRNGGEGRLSSTLSIEMGPMFPDSRETDTSQAVFTRSPTCRGRMHSVSSQDTRMLRASPRRASNRKSKTNKNTLDSNIRYRAISRVPDSEPIDLATRKTQTKSIDLKSVFIPRIVSDDKGSPLKTPKTVPKWFGPYDALSLSILSGSSDDRIIPLRRSYSDTTGFRTNREPDCPDQKEHSACPPPELVPKSLTIVIDFRNNDLKTAVAVV